MGRPVDGCRAHDPERYRSGRNGGASKASCRVTGTGVRIPPSPPTLYEIHRFPNVFRLFLHQNLGLEKTSDGAGDIQLKTRMKSAFFEGRFF